MKFSTKQYLTALGFSMTTLLGCGESGKNPSPKVQAKSSIDYDIKVDEIFSITAGKGEITFSRLSVCSKTELECQPVILVFDIHGNLVSTFKAADTDHVHISSIDENKFLDRAKNTEIQPEKEYLDFAAIQKNFYEFNRQALSRCRSSQGWELMNAVNETTRNVLYIHFGVKNLENRHTMFRLDTSNGALELSENKDGLNFSNVEAPIFVINAKDQNGNIRQNDSLIYFYNFHEKCTQAYKFLNLPYPEFDDKNDKTASSLVDHMIQRENKDYEFSDPLFPSIEYSQTFWASELNQIKADENLIQKD